MDAWMTTPGNHTEADPDIGQFIADIVAFIMIAVVAVIGIIGNILNLVVISQIPEETMGEATQVLFIALSLADLMTAVMLLNSVIVFFWYNEWVSSDSGAVFCKVTGFIGTCAPPVSAISIFLLNVDRYIQVTRPFLYENLVTRKKVVTSVSLVTFATVGTMLLFVAISEKSFDIIRFQKVIGLCQIDFADPSFLPYTVACFAFIWMVAILLLVMYADIVRIARRHFLQISAQQIVVARFSTRNDEVQSVCSTVDLGPTQDITEIKMGGIQEGPIVPPIPNVRNPVRARRNEGIQKVRAKRNGSILPNLRTLRTPLIITSCFLLAWLPFTIALTYASASGERLNGIVLRVVASMAASNCIVNIFVYLITRSDFKKAFRKILCRRR